MIDIFLQYRVALTWIYPAVKYAAYRPGDPNIQQEIKKCDQPLDIQLIDDYCHKQKKLVKSSSLNHVQSFEQIKISKQNINQNCAINTMSDFSFKYQKKRKQNSTMTAIDDFNRYLYERKLYNIGIINLQTHKLNRNSHSLCKFNPIVRILVVI